MSVATRPSEFNSHRSVRNTLAFITEVRVAELVGKKRRPMVKRLSWTGVHEGTRLQAAGRTRGARSLRALGFQSSQTEERQNGNHTNDRPSKPGGMNADTV